MNEGFPQDAVKSTKGSAIDNLGRCGHKRGMGNPGASAVRSFVNGTRVRGREDDYCPQNFRGRSGTVIGYYVGSGCLVRFDDGGEEFAYVHWLERTGEAMRAVEGATA